MYSSTTEIPANLLAVSAHTAASVTLNGTPAVGEGIVRIWYLYAMASTDSAADLEIAPRFVTDARNVYLDAQFLNALLNLSDLTNVPTARLNLGFVAQTAGNVLLGDGSTTFTSDADLFFDTATNRLGVGTNTPSQSIHDFSAAASVVALLETQFTGGVPEIRLQAARTANADLANADVVGDLSFYGRRNSTTSELSRIRTIYTGNGTTQSADLVFYTAQAGVPTEVLRLNASGQIDTTLGAGAMQTDASGIVSSGTLGVTLGGTGTATQFTTGSVVFAGASGVYNQDNAYLFYDVTNHRLGLGTTTPSSLLTIKNVTDSLNEGIAIEGQGAGVNVRWIHYVSPTGDYAVYHPFQANYGWSLSPTGRFAAANGLASQTNSGALTARNNAGRQADNIIVALNLSGQTGDAFAHYLDDFVTKPFSVNASGSVTAPSYTATTSIIIQDPGAGTNTVTLQAGVVSASYAITLPLLQGAAGTTLVNNGSGVLTWERPAGQKAGSITLSSGTTTQAVTFATAKASANYSISWAFKNTVDSDPMGLPFRVIAQATTGFTIEWDNALDTANYIGLWSVEDHYDP